MTAFRSGLALLPAALLLLSCHRTPMASSTSSFAAVPPTIDGQAAEWTDSLHYDPGSKLQYQVLNDGRQVYLRLKAADPATQAKIVRLGLTVWLDTTGRHQHQFGVHFPLGGPLGPRSGADDGAPRPDASAPMLARQEGRRERMAQALSGMREMELLHYKGSPEPTLTDTQSQLGVKAALALDAQENLIYELAVPLRLLYPKLPTISGRPAVLGVTLAGGKFSMPSAGGGMQGGGMRGGMGGGGMRGGMGGGGMRGGMGGGGMRGGGSRGSYSGQQSAPIDLKTSINLVSK